MCLNNNANKGNWPGGSVYIPICALPGQSGCTSEQPSPEAQRDRYTCMYVLENQHRGATLYPQRAICALSTETRWHFGGREPSMCIEKAIAEVLWNEASGYVRLYVH